MWTGPVQPELNSVCLESARDRMSSFKVLEEESKRTIDGKERELQVRGS
jgi:hypothetical protein